ncbi:hypothetical protein QR680_015484 [Steinernema hermaphroditum]|uniref:Uncharacterized protein n=1 Tax=Steinernema hermaphroditum TaxID=289476 RepID=A0AA39H8X4_9BILA|nr:hypothetical protein QR680_015484 [Steinernema hermaphroditum]
MICISRNRLRNQRITWQCKFLHIKADVSQIEIEASPTASMQFVVFVFVLFFSTDSYTPVAYGRQWGTPVWNSYQWITPGWTPYFDPYYGVYGTTAFGGPFGSASSPSPFK